MHAETIDFTGVAEDYKKWFRKFFLKKFGSIEKIFTYLCLEIFTNA